VFEDGGQRRDFVSVRDVAAANVAALEASTGGVHVYNVGSGEPRTVLDLATALHGVLGGPAPRVTGSYRLGDVRHVVASPERARQELGFTAVVRPDDGLPAFATAPLR
jgi:dTDP-L-rhamnose 4-epimerase